MFDTPRLALRAFRESDLEAMFDMFDTYDVQAQASPYFIVPHSRSDRDVFQKALVSDRLMFATIEEKTTSRYVGFVSLRDFNPRHRDVEVALLLEKGSWGKGYGTEVMEWLVDYGFRVLGLHRLSLQVFASNQAAIALYKKSGFIQEGVKRKAAWIDGTWVDLIAMGIIAEEFWEARKEPV
ncbi:acyl-CoA N-acyltransferase [Dentipellis sp. KUC8613]|nr:acyl-CoA N-acyltransferase [Dentipellis sp. KUC8613]